MMTREIQLGFNEMSLILLLLTVGAVLIGCSEETEYVEYPVSHIRAIAGFEDALYLASKRYGLFRFDNKNQSWERVDEYNAYSFFADETTLYIGTSNGIYHVASGSRIHTPLSKSIPELQNRQIPGLQNRQIRDHWLNKSTEALAVEGDNIYAVEWSSSFWGHELVHYGHGGRTRRQINISGHDKENVQNVLIAGTSIYVVVEQQGVYRSNDGGHKWSAINQGLPGTSPYVYREFQYPLLFHKNTVYIGTPKGVYRLPDGETIWMPTELNALAAISLAASPTTLYAGTWPEGVFRSTDGGHSWQNIGLFESSITALTLFNNKLYAADYSGNGVFYTSDEGTTWHPLSDGLVVAYQKY